MNKEVTVTFEPSGRSVYALPGTVLLETAARSGYILETPRGGGKFGKCLVRITTGKRPPSTHESEKISAEELEQEFSAAMLFPES
jgi:uncharacterized 2Fe-2S/4Fe-4S cluster protein (DUF4445 family)